MPGIGDALVNSIEIAVLSTLAPRSSARSPRSRLSATSSAAAAPINFFIFIPLATPEVVLGAALLSLFLNGGHAALGFGTILIAHIMFNLSFVVVTVRSRLIGFDRALEEAAQDLGATPWETFRLVTLPLIMPGVIAAALLAFALSIDDFVITYFNAGSTITFPLFIWGAAQGGGPAPDLRDRVDDLPLHIGDDAAHGLAATPGREDGRGPARARGGLDGGIRAGSRAQ